MASGPITSWEIDGETAETVSDFIFGGAPSICHKVMGTDAMILVFLMFSFKPNF